MPYMDVYVPNPLVEQNIFKKLEPQYGPTPTFEEARPKLPDPYWNGHGDAIECYWKAWRSAFTNLKKATPENKFHVNYVDTGYYMDFFMWDTSFCMFFGRYGVRAFDFIRSLDNFYARQHEDGYICRQLSDRDGGDKFHRFEPGGTGPNIMAWPEWEYYRAFGDKKRLEAVFPVLVAFYQWYKKYRTWPDGGYWSTGWSSGMDNQPRLGGGDKARMFYHGHHTWIDACLQQIMTAKQLCMMANELGRTADTAEIGAEAVRLADYVNSRMWDEKSGFYYDLDEAGNIMDVKSIAAFWAFLAGIVPDNRIDRFVSHLNETNEFNRLHRVPSLSADHPEYSGVGKYWRGGVWPNTNYMIVRGLKECGRAGLAREIAMNHLDVVTKVYKETGELWENYAADACERGNISKADYVGWSGLTPICGLLEDAFGINMEPWANRVVWEVGLTDEFGVAGLPYNARSGLSLKCKRRANVNEKPNVAVICDEPIRLVLRWGDGHESIHDVPACVGEYRIIK